MLIVRLAQHHSHFMVRENGCPNRVVGGCRLAGSEIDFMAESDAAPRKGVCVHVSICVCEQGFSVDSKGHTIAR